MNLKYLQQVRYVKTTETSSDCVISPFKASCMNKSFNSNKNSSINEKYDKKTVSVINIRMFYNPMLTTKRKVWKAITAIKQSM